MIAGLLSILGSSAVGSIIGGVLAFLNRKNDLELRRLDNAHDLNRWVHEKELRQVDIEVAKAEAAGNFRVAQAEADGLFEAERMKAIADIENADNITADEIRAAGKLGWVFVFASAYRRSIRPLVTTVLVVTVLLIDFQLLSEVTSSPGAMTPELRRAMLNDVTSWLFGQTAVVLGYWFVARGSSGK